MAEQGEHSRSFWFRSISPCVSSFYCFGFWKAKTAVRKKKIRAIKLSKKPWIKPPLFQCMMKYCMNLCTTWSINSPGLYLDEKVGLCSACKPCFFLMLRGQLWGYRIRSATLKRKQQQKRNSFMLTQLFNGRLFLCSAAHKLVLLFVPGSLLFYRPWMSSG